MLAGVFAIGGCLGESPAKAGPEPMTLGVQTHFSQGWNGSFLDLLRPVSKARAVRDSVPWSQVEKQPGRYDFSGPRVAVLDRYCRDGGTLLLTEVPLNPIYEDGKALRQGASYDAFARYVLALADHFGPCLIAVEIGNEINAPHTPQLGAVEAGTGKVPRASKPGDGIVNGNSDGLKRYVDLVATVHTAVHQGGRSVQVLGGSTNLIATGFLDDLFVRGLLHAADGIAVHPYRLVPEGTDIELAHLQQVMRRHGKPLPIWVTEFSDNFVDPERAANHLVKITAMMSASGISRAYWYALIDQKWYPTMGLYRLDGSAKPAAGAFRLMGEKVLPLGPAAPMAPPDAPARLYRFGPDAWVAWGVGEVRFSAGSRLTDARGRPIAGTEAVLSDAPVIATGAREARYVPGTAMADSLLGYGTSRWTYQVIKPDGERVPLTLLDGRWGSHFESRFFRPAFVDQVSGAPAGKAGAPVRVAVRYTAPGAERVSISACIVLRARSAKAAAAGVVGSKVGDGVDAVLTAGRTELARAIISGSSQRLEARGVDLAAGQPVDLSIGPNETSGNDRFYYRMRIEAEPAVAHAPCPAPPGTA